MPVRALYAAAALLAAWHGSAWAASFAVDDLADAVDAAPGDGACASSRGTCTLRAAVQETNALAGADQITLAVGVHELTLGGAGENAAATGDLDVADDLTISGANAYLSVVDANGLDRVLNQVPPFELPIRLVLRDLTLTGGNAAGSGGGLLHASGVDAERVIVTGNAALGSGGAIAATNVAFDEPSLDLRVSIVSLNRAREGGGIFAAEPESFSVERSIVIANSAVEDGGGISASLESAPIRLDRVTLYGNNAGDAIFAVRNLSLDRSWVGHNLVGSWGAPLPDFGRGGGVALFAGLNATITNSTIEGNLAARGGGVALGSSGAVTITHATIARNRASSSNPFNGGGVRSEDEVEEGPVVNTVLAENLPTNCDEWGLDSAGHNLADDASCGLGAPGDLQDVDAQLGPLGNFGGPTRSIPPLPGSPAVEGGADAGIPIDQRGVSRPQLAQFDIGAVERRGLREPERYADGSATRPHRCDIDRNGRVDFADLDRLIASFPAAGGGFRGDADRRLRQCVASCTHAGCPPVALIPKPRRRG